MFVNQQDMSYSTHSVSILFFVVGLAYRKPVARDTCLQPVPTLMMWNLLTLYSPVKSYQCQSKYIFLFIHLHAHTHTLTNTLALLTHILQIFQIICISCAVFLSYILEKILYLLYRISEYWIYILEFRSTCLWGKKSKILRNNTLNFYYSM